MGSKASWLTISKSCVMIGCRVVVEGYFSCLKIFDKWCTTGIGARSLLFVMDINNLEVSVRCMISTFDTKTDGVVESDEGCLRHISSLINRNVEQTTTS